MKKITFSRPKEPFNKNCAYHIVVGNKTLTTLKNGEEKTIEIPTQLENQSISAKINWCGSNKLELNNLANGAGVEVIGNSLFNRKLIFVGAFLPLIGLSFTLNHQIAWLKYLGVSINVLLVIICVGVVTIWKNHWIILQSKGD